MFNFINSGKTMTLRCTVSLLGSYSIYKVISVLRIYRLMAKNIIRKEQSVHCKLKHVAKKHERPNLRNY